MAVKKSMGSLQPDFEHQFILHALGDAVIATDLDRRILWTNPAFSRLFGYSPEEALSQTTSFLYANPGNYEEQGRFRYNLEAAPDPHPYDMLYRKKEGGTFWGEARGATVTNRKGERIGFMVAIRDITRRKDLLHALHTEKDRWFVTLKSIGDAVITTDEHGRVVYLNPVAEHLTGWTTDAARDQPVEAVFRIVNEHTRATADNPVERALSEGVIVGLANHTLLLSRDGREFSIEDSAAPIRDDEGRIRGCVIVFRDVTEKRRLEQRIAHQANTDALTNLPNRHLFQDRLSRTIARSRRSEKSFALLYLDVDHFKNVNDRLGHPFGDRILVELGRRFESALRKADTVARLGGDEFAVILENLSDRTEALTLGQRLMNEAAASFRIDGSRVDLTVSVGVALYPDDGTDMATLVRNADIALFQVKREGRNNIQFFSEEMNRIVQDRLAIEADLRESLEEKNGFFLLYQPIIDLGRSQAVGVEALLRWRHRLRVRLPEEFIPVAEETGLIVPLGQWVLQTAIGQARSWLDRGFSLSRMAVNVAVKQIHSDHFVEELGSLLTEHRIDPSLLELEITEGTLLFRDHHTLETLKSLRNLGVRISIDDFGTGYSALNYLRHFPVNTLKIDRSFLNDMLSNHYDQAIVRAILTLGQSLSLDTVAEGVEEEDQARFLKENGCSLVQGYFYSQAVSPERIEPFLSGPDPMPPT
ncbi:MAG: EAL domain-containing protein [Nitrospirae bacterium]|nr:EAL domain-containing protein [Nitrospirota bacterium]